MTYKKLAELCGVSPSTVSKALSGSKEIKKETADMIRRLADEYNVTRPNYHRDRSLAKIAIIVPEIISVYYSQITTTLVEIFESYGIMPEIHVCGFEAEKFCRLIDILREEKRIDGIISISNYTYPHKPDVPTMVLDSYSQLNVDAIRFDNARGFIDAVEHLISLGHRRIGFVSERYTCIKPKQFSAALKAAGLAVDESLNFESDKRFEEVGYEAVEYYMTLDRLPTAIVCAYDEIALGAMYAFSKRGVDVPRDISVVGMNNIPNAAYSIPPLTTVAYPCGNDAAFTRAVKLLLENIHDPDAHKNESIIIEPHLLIRESTAVPREI